MITLKDIKVSKNRIPVQNALWLRPIGGLAIKIYYPRGGNWQEIVTTGSDEEAVEEIPDSSQNQITYLTRRIESLSNKVEAAINTAYRNQDNITKVSKSITEIKEQIASINEAIENMHTEDDYPESVELSASFNNIPEYASILASASDLANYGFTDLVLRSIERGTCTHASITGDSLGLDYTIAHTGSRAEGNLAITLTSSNVSGSSTLFVYTIQQGGGVGSIGDLVTEIMYSITKDIWM